MFGIRRIALMMGAAVGVTAWAAYVILLATWPAATGEFSFYPFAVDPVLYTPMRGFSYEQFWSHVWRAALLGPALALLSVVAARYLVLNEPNWRRVTQWGVGLGLLACAALMLAVLRGAALSDDEIIYRLQAELLSSGRLAYDELIWSPRMVPTVHGTVTGKYLFGEPLLQVVGLPLGIPAILHLPLLAALLWCHHAATLKRTTTRFAALSTLALALSPNLIFTGATGVTQLPTLTFLVVADYALAKFADEAEARGRWLAALALGGALGFATTIRVQAAAPVGLVLGACFLLTALRRRDFYSVPIAGVGALPFAVALGAYNWAITGHPLRLPWFQACDYEHYGFGRVWHLNTFEHTPWTAVENLLVVLTRLNVWWLGLPLGLLLALPPLLRVVPFPRKLRHHLVLGLAVIVFEAGYYSPGISDTGSLYHFELLLPLSALGAATVQHALSVAPRATLATLVVHLGLGAPLFWYEQATRLGRLKEAIHGKSERAIATVPPNSVVFAESKASGYLAQGWVYHGPPERLDRRLPVVVLPRQPASWMARSLAKYAGRSCYYVRFEGEASVSVTPCALAAQHFAEPVTIARGERALRYSATAYVREGFDPLKAAIQHDVKVDESTLVLCCMLRFARKLELPTATHLRCVDDKGQTIPNPFNPKAPER